MPKPLPRLRRDAVAAALSAALAAWAALAALTGCTPATQSLVEITPLRHLLGHPPEPTFNPRYRYLRLTVNGRPFYMALGFIEGRPGARTDVWYSSVSEVLRLRDGLVVGSAGLPVNWVDVRYSAWPSWTHAAQTLTRSVDVQPGYRFGLRQRLELRPVPSPGARELVGVDPRSVRWFALRDQATQRIDYYAVRATPGRRPDVIYGEQCLDARLCLTWQHWPAHR